MTWILGLNAFHGDSAACIVKDGQLVAAAEEERFRRIKHWAGFPSEAIRYCLEEAGIGPHEVDHIAINRDPRANFGRKVRYTLLRTPSPAMVLSRLRNRKSWGAVMPMMQAAFPGQEIRAAVHQIEHHYAHMASAFHVSPYEDAVAVSVDGFGDFASAAWGVGRGTNLTLDGQVHFPHSLGIFYQALTQYLGFRHYGDEYKVMGLAPYGAPRFMDAMRRIVELQTDGTFRLNLRYFVHHSANVPYEWNGGSPSIGTLYSPALATLLGPPREPDAPLEDRHRDLARSTQAMYEEAFFHLLNHVHDRYRIPRLALAGGCAFNSVANGKIRRSTPFADSYIQAAAGDAGGAIGAALAVSMRLGTPRPEPMTHAYWGPAFGDRALADAIAARKRDIGEQGCQFDEIADETELCRRTAEAIAAGKVVGWFQGRLEWGPRALGNRSILCDPRRADMKDLLNRKIKRRESFRPFAPSVLREAVAAWFEEDDDVPFMMKVFQIREDKRRLIPAVTHVDGSGRLQTVEAAANPRYHRLISSFGAITGVPMVLNTSFNENEPVVCRPEEALDCFLRTRMDLLVLGDFIVERVAAEQRPIRAGAPAPASD